MHASSIVRVFFSFVDAQARAPAHPFPSSRPSLGHLAAHSLAPHRQSCIPPAPSCDAPGNCNMQTRASLLSPARDRFHIAPYPISSRTASSVCCVSLPMFNPSCRCPGPPGLACLLAAAPDPSPAPVGGFRCSPPLICSSRLGAASQALDLDRYALCWTRGSTVRQGRQGWLHTRTHTRAHAQTLA